MNHRPHTFVRFLFTGVLAWTGAGFVHAAGMDGSAADRGRQWLASGDPAKVRMVLRSLEMELDPAARDGVRGLLVEGKRALEMNLDAEITRRLARRTALEVKTEQLWQLRLATRATAPAPTGKSAYDAPLFRTAIITLVKAEAECAKLNTQPQMVAEATQPLAPGLVESLQLVNAELARFYPGGGLWVKSHPLAGSFDGGRLTESAERVTAFLAELKQRGPLLASAERGWAGLPPATQGLLRQIQTCRVALGLPPLAFEPAFTPVLRKWADDLFGEGQLPKTTPGDAVSDIEDRADTAGLGAIVYQVVILPGVPQPKECWDWFTGNPAAVAALADPRVSVLGAVQLPQGVVLAAAKSTRGK